jgi:hypothetical protein
LKGEEGGGALGMDGWMGGREKGTLPIPLISFIHPTSLPPTFSSSYKIIINFTESRPLFLIQKDIVTCGSKFIMLIHSQPKLAILLLSSLVIIKFSHTERISLRIQSPSAEEGKGQLLNFKYLRNFIKLKAILL